VAATEQLAEARRLAEEATAAAEAASESAHQEAQRLSARAKSGADERDIVVAEAEKLQKANASAATAVTRKVTRTRRPANRSTPRKSTSSGSARHRGPNLTSLSKQELVERARARDIAGRSEMSKAQLVKALRATNGRRGR
jgi:DNA end-binding protein Ku